MWMDGGLFPKDKWKLFLSQMNVNLWKPYIYGLMEQGELFHIISQKTTYSSKYGRPYTKKSISYIGFLH